MHFVIDPKYYKKSVEIILELGNKLVHFVWINLFPKDVEPAYVRLDEIAYRLIENERQKLASTILQFGLNEIKKNQKKRPRHGSDSIKRQMVINNANAEKLSGNIEEAKKILSTEDWTATSQKYNICVAAINDDVDYIIDHMSSAVKSKSLYIDNFREWAVFQWLIPLSQVLPYLAASLSPRDDFGRRFGLYPSCPGAFRWLSFCDVAYA